jgi:hypothetical protein
MFPGFPVEVGGVVELHAAFREESRTRGGVPEPRNRKSGFAPAYMGRKRFLRMLLLHSRTVLPETLRLRMAKAVEGANPHFSQTPWGSGWSGSEVFIRNE